MRSSNAPTQRILARPRETREADSFLESHRSVGYHVNFMAAKRWTCTNLVRLTTFTSRDDTTEAGEQSNLLASVAF